MRRPLAQRTRPEVLGADQGRQKRAAAAAMRPLVVLVGEMLNENKGGTPLEEFLSKIDPPVSLKELKDSKLFEEFALVRQSRLSTMAVPPEFVAWLKRLRPSLKP